jgi:hypothetical protein
MPTVAQDSWTPAKPAGSAGSAGWVMPVLSRRLALRPLLVVAFGALALLAAPVQALILSASPNAVHLSTRAEVSFEGISRVASTRNDSAIADTPGVSVSSSADRRLLPFSGGPKDLAEGRVTLNFLGGSGLERDVFSIDFSGNASAVTAEVAAGDPAGARVALQGRMLFQLDSAYTGLPADTLYGFLHMDSPGPAFPYETFSVKAFDLSHGLLGTLVPGGDALDLKLLVGHAYEIVFSYEMSVPYGIDPDIALRLEGWLGVKAPVPEPSSLGLSLLGLLVLGLRMRRHA